MLFYIKIKKRCAKHQFLKSSAYQITCFLRFASIYCDTTCAKPCLHISKKGGDIMKTKLEPVKKIKLVKPTKKVNKMVNAYTTEASNPGCNVVSGCS